MKIIFIILSTIFLLVLCLLSFLGINFDKVFLISFFQGLLPSKPNFPFYPC